MPIPIDDDLLDEPLIRDLVSKRVRQGEARGEARGGGFASQPVGAKVWFPTGLGTRSPGIRGSEQLEEWGVRLLDATVWNRSCAVSAAGPSRAAW